MWAATALTACGRLGYEPVPAGDTDAMPGADVVRPDARPAPDAQPPQPDAPPGPFRAAALIEELAAPDADDDDPSLTGDLLEIYFKSDRGTPGDFDIWLSTRASRADPWGEPDVVVELSSDEDEWAAVTDESGTHVVITRSVPGNVLDLLGASRASADEPWGAPAPLANLATPVYEADGHLDPSGLRLFFAGELAGGDGRDIYIAERPSPEDDFGPPARVAELSSGSRDEDPWVSPDGNVIVISSDRTGDQELYWSSR